MDATAYLLERSGDILGAFKLIREVLYMYTLVLVHCTYMYMYMSMYALIDYIYYSPQLRT